MAGHQFPIHIHAAEGDEAEAAALGEGDEAGGFRHAQHGAGHELTGGFERCVMADGEEDAIEVLSGVFGQEFEQGVAGYGVFDPGGDDFGAEAGGGGDYGCAGGGGGAGGGGAEGGYGLGGVGVG